MTNSDSNNSSNNARVVPLIISDKQKGIIVRSVFAIDTRDIIISLNHKYEDSKIIFSIERK